MATNKCPWSIQPKLPEVSLYDVMSEQLASQLESEDISKLQKLAAESAPDPGLLPDLLTDQESSNDEIIAHVLQADFDRQYDEELTKIEKKYNGSSKVGISLSNFRRRPESFKYDSDTSDDQEDYDDWQRDWDSFEKNARVYPAIPRCGYTKQGSEVITKHDIGMCNRRNACRVMEMSTGIATGDGGGFDMQLPNKVYNTLKKFWHKDWDRNHRNHDKSEQATAGRAIDPRTMHVLYRIVETGLLKDITGFVSTGKESVVLHGEGGVRPDDDKDEETAVIPPECAIKIYKTSIMEFKKREQYIRDDHRFKDRFSKQSHKLVQLWAEKEMFNLKRMSRAGIPCPTVVKHRKHLLIMSFIGKAGIPAPKLKEINLTPEEWSTAYEQVVDYTKNLFAKCRLVHSDLSEYNMLWHEGQVFLIDVGQSVEPSHPNALLFLYRDCCNVSNFFLKKGVPRVKSATKLFSYVSGLNLEDGTDVQITAQIQDFEQNEQLLTRGLTNKESPFDAMWGKTDGKGNIAEDVKNVKKAKTKRNSLTLDA